MFFKFMHFRLKPIIMLYFSYMYLVNKLTGEKKSVYEKKNPKP